MTDKLKPTRSRITHEQWYGRAGRMPDIEIKDMPSHDDEPERSLFAEVLNGVQNLIIIALAILGGIVVLHTLEYYYADRFIPRCTEYRLVRAINLNFL